MNQPILSPLTLWLVYRLQRHLWLQKIFEEACLLLIKERVEYSNIRCSNYVLWVSSHSTQRTSQLLAAAVNTVCQQKGPLSKHENRKFPKPFQGCLGMLVGPPSAQKFWLRPHWPAHTADFKCYFWLFQQFCTSKKPHKMFSFDHFFVSRWSIGVSRVHKRKISRRMLTQLE